MSSRVLKIIGERQRHFLAVLDLHHSRGKHQFPLFSRQMEMHISNHCALTEVTCPYAKAGCPFKVCDVDKLISSHSCRASVALARAVILYIDTGE